MTIEELKNRKTALGLTNEMIAKAADLPLSTVQKIMSGATKAPRKATLVAIEKVLSSEEHLRSSAADHTQVTRNNYTYENLPEARGMVRKSAAEYKYAPVTGKKDGEYTLDDYYALPDERRVELIHTPEDTGRTVHSFSGVHRCPRRGMRGLSVSLRCKTG